MRKLFLIGLIALIPTNVFSSPFGWVVSTYDLTATSYTYCITDPFGSTPTCGTAITNGWVTMLGGRPVVVSVDWITKAATSLDYSIECRSYTSGLGQALTTGSLTAAGSNMLVITSVAQGFDQCRIGLKLTTDTGTNSVSAYFSAR